MRLRRSSRVSWLLFSGALALGALWAGLPALAKGKDKVTAEPARYVPTYAAAWAQARTRNAVLMAVFHKDN